MRPTPMDPRKAARWTIIQAANVHRMRERARRWRREWLPVVPLYGMRQLQRAVFVCRLNQLVADEVLVAAGFRPNRPIGDSAGITAAQPDRRAA